MEGCFGKMDSEVAGDTAVRTVGSTAVVAVVSTTEIVVANCGDSRAVIGRAGEAIDLSTDHKVCIYLRFLDLLYIYAVF
jgi:protein phosphatase 2C